MAGCKDSLDVGQIVPTPTAQGGFVKKIALIIFVLSLCISVLVCIRRQQLRAQLECKRRIYDAVSAYLPRDGR